MQLDTHHRTSTAITVNGERTETPARTLAELVAAGGFAETQVATALNGDFCRERREGHHCAQRRRRGGDRGAAAGRLINFHDGCP